MNDTLPFVALLSSFDHRPKLYRRGVPELVGAPLECVLRDPHHFAVTVSLSYAATALAFPSAVRPPVQLSTRQMVRRERTLGRPSS